VDADRLTAIVKLIALLNRDVWRLEHDSPQAAQQLLELVSARLAT
jgi:hypothetical protein